VSRQREAREATSRPDAPEAPRLPQAPAGDRRAEAPEAGAQPRAPAPAGQPGPAATTGAVAGVILDMDGLLIDTEPVWRAAEHDVFAELGTQLSEAEMLSTMGRPIVAVVAHWRRRRPWPGAESGEPDDAAVAGRVVDRMVTWVSTEGEPARGAIGAAALLRRLGLRLGIASSSPPRLIDAVCGRLGLDWIEVRCSASDERRGKPAPDIFLTCARRLGLEPALCLAVEDSPNGVLAAKAAGMRCIAVPDRLLATDPRYQNADLVLSSLTELDEAALLSLGWSHPPGDAGDSSAV